MSIGGSVFRRTSAALAAALSVPFLAQAAGRGEPALQLHSRVFSPGPGLEEGVLRRAAEAKGGRIHVLLQLGAPATRAVRRNLQAQGVELLKYVPSNGYFASVPADAGRLRRVAVADGVRFVGEIRAEDKLAPELARKEAAPWSETGDGRRWALVRFHGDVTEAEARAVLRKAGAEVRGAYMRTLKAFQAALPEAGLDPLASFDAVQWISALPPEGEDDNEGSRTRIRASQAQAAPLNLDGTAVLVGQWETGHPDTSHDDFGGRVTIADSVPLISDHATHVAGTVLGSGALSAGAQKGMAPAAGIVSTKRPTIGSALDVATLEEQYDAAINDFDKGIELSTNSWGTTHCDQLAATTCYAAGSELYDEIIRGSLGARISIVGSAGNRGDDVTPNWGTVRVPNSAKNTIVVGATYSDTDLVTNFSSRGPVDDGRLKPDVMAPGDENENGLGDCNGDMIRSTIPGDTYGENCGTSMSTPAVAGAAALLIDRWRDVQGPGAADPWPSTVKGLLIHTAVDRGNVGPDFTYGYGRIDVRAAAGLLRATPSSNDRVIQRVIEDTGEQDTYTFTVPPPPPSPFLPRPIRVKVTLVWDDAAGNPALARGTPQLVNDLDLEVVAPGGAVNRPWLLNPANPAAAATTGADHLNNVEKVEVPSVTGNWTVRVRGNAVNEGPQPYSLIYEIVYSVFILPPPPIPFPPQLSALLQ